MKTKFKLPEKENNFFFLIANEIIYNEPFTKLKNYKHHGNISTYSHSIKVAYLSYYYAIKYHIKVNHKNLILAGLLHDLYFYDWHDKDNGIHLHGLFHPAKALKNAQKYYHINKEVKRGMAHHMFPLTLIPPTTKIGWIICICDKIAAKKDYKAIKKSKKIKGRKLK